MKLTEQALLDSETQELELTYQWENMEHPDRVSVWYDDTVDRYYAKFQNCASVSFNHFAGVVCYLGKLVNNHEWV